mmetsp:Transcript_30262/g.48847  ORF Transcript_30262/g.48847 Transcript_30262/m.48847 type:complete len:82 (-) Transcript_30262:74-319(-)
MHMNRGVVDIEGVVICAAIFGLVLIFYLCCPSPRLTDYCNTLNNKIACLSALLLATRVFAPLPMTRQLPMGVEDAETPSRA